MEYSFTKYPLGSIERAKEQLKNNDLSKAMKNNEVRRYFDRKS